MNPVKGPDTGALTSSTFSSTTFFVLSAAFLIAFVAVLVFFSSSSDEDELSLSLSLPESEAESELDDEDEDEEDDEEEEEDEEEAGAGAAAAIAALTAFLGVDDVSATGGGTAANLPVVKKHETELVD